MINREKFYKSFVERYGEHCAQIPSIHASFESLRAYAGLDNGAMSALRRYCIIETSAILTLVEGLVPGRADNKLVEICRQLSGEHFNLAELRGRADPLLKGAFPGPGHRRMTILPAGGLLRESQRICGIYLMKSEKILFIQLMDLERE